MSQTEFHFTTHSSLTLQMLHQWGKKKNINMLCSCAIISSYIKTLHLFITPSAPLDLLPPSPLHNLLPLPNPLHNLLPLLPFSGMSPKVVCDRNLIPYNKLGA